MWPFSRNYKIHSCTVHTASNHSYAVKMCIFGDCLYTALMLWCKTVIRYNVKNLLIFYIIILYYIILYYIILYYIILYYIILYYIMPAEIVGSNPTGGMNVCLL